MYVGLCVRVDIQSVSTPLLYIDRCLVSAFVNLFTGKIAVWRCTVLNWKYLWIVAMLMLKKRQVSPFQLDSCLYVGLYPGVWEPYHLPLHILAFF